MSGEESPQRRGFFFFRSSKMKRETDPARRNRIKDKRAKFSWLSKFFRNRPSQRSLQDRNIYVEEPAPASRNKFFGVPLADVYEDQARLIDNAPIPVYHCARTIEKFLDLEGIFRVSGTFSEMNKLTEEFENGRIPDLEKAENKHSVSGLLEKYFRELPQPVTTWSMYEDFMKSADESLDTNGQIEYLRGVINRMPAPNRALLGFFLNLMKKISKYEEVNKMGARNLGVVFGSIILGPENLLLTLGDKKKLQNQSVVVGLLIAHCYDLYPNYAEADGDDLQIHSSSAVPVHYPESHSEADSSHGSGSSTPHSAAAAIPPPLNSDYSASLHSEMARRLSQVPPPRDSSPSRFSQAGYDR